MTDQATRFYVARTSFATIIDDLPVVVKQGELVREGDPLLDSGRIKLFDSYEPESRFDHFRETPAVPRHMAVPRERPLGLTEDPTPREVIVSETTKIQTTTTESREVEGDPDTKVVVESTPHEVTTTKQTKKPATTETTTSKVPR
jgi:hypothetical protein